MPGQNYERRLYSLRDKIGEQLEEAMHDITVEISEALVKLYGEHVPERHDDSPFRLVQTGWRCALVALADELGFDDLEDLFDRGDELPTQEAKMYRDPEMYRHEAEEHFRALTYEELIEKDDRRRAALGEAPIREEGE